ncbi:conserved hypothetical protein [Candidatus Sulfopaludibacter sp. SbA4]|nr:conserved hypothetical protein [Candidatus Sulfopaludibacter sp. SbA4]
MSENGNISVEPNNTLSQTTDSQQRPNRFILFSDSWLNLQNYITTCLALPINQGDFGTKYGDFADLNLVKQVVAAMKKVQGLTTVFGNPIEFYNKLTVDPDYVLKPEPPTEIYAHIVWLAMQIQGAASMYTNTFDSFRVILDPKTGTKEERARYLKDALLGEGGLVSVAEDIKKKTNALRAKLSSFSGQISDANGELVRYTSQQSQIMKTANDAIAEIKKTIEELTAKSEAAEKAWRDFTIAAAVASVGLAILSCLCLILAPFTFGTTVAVAGGLAVGAVAAATALGIAAENQRKEYKRLLGDIEKEKGKQEQKTLLVTDLTALNRQVAQVGTGMTDFSTNLAVIEGIWLDIAGKLTYLCSNYQPEQLSNYPWIVQATRLNDATKKWQEISQITTEFTQNSLVKYERKEFGAAVEVAA